GRAATVDPVEDLGDPVRRRAGPLDERRKHEGRQRMNADHPPRDTNQRRGTLPSPHWAKPNGAPDSRTRGTLPSPHWAKPNGAPDSRTRGTLPSPHWAKPNGAPLPAGSLRSAARSARGGMRAVRP